MQHVHALVIGDLMLDHYVSGTVERVSPEAPVPVVRVEGERAAIGGAANVAANVAALGAACSVVGCVGTDAHGDVLVRELRALGVETEGITRAPQRPTTSKTRVMARHQQIVRFDREDDSDVSDELAALLSDTIRRLAPSADVLIVEDYNKGVLVPSVITTVVEEGRRHGVPTVVDPKRRNFFGFQGVTLFKPNAKELADALGEPVRPDDPEWMEGVRVSLGCRHLLLTLGERGVVLQSEGRTLTIPAASRAVYDVSGAGDTVTAVAATALAACADPSEAAVLATHAAAVEVGKSGVATVSTAEVLDHVRSTV